MMKLLTILHNYIEAAQVTVYSTSMPGYDDVPGLGGIQVHDSYALQLFYQQCLYFSKGLAQYIAISSINQYIIPTALEDNADPDDVWNNDQHGNRSSSFVSYLLNEFERHHNYCSYVIPTSYGYPDPQSGKYSLYHAWGPGDSVWGRGTTLAIAYT